MAGWRDYLKDLQAVSKGCNLVENHSPPRLSTKYHRINFKVRSEATLYKFTFLFCIQENLVIYGNESLLLFSFFLLLLLPPPPFLLLLLLPPLLFLFPLFFSFPISFYCLFLVLFLSLLLFSFIPSLLSLFPFFSLSF